jgi:hypothetical protein
VFATLVIVSVLPVVRNMTPHVLDAQIVSINGNSTVLFVASFVLKVTILLKLDNISMLPSATTLPLGRIIRPIVNVKNVILVVHTVQSTLRIAICVWIPIIYLMIVKTA